MFKKGVVFSLLAVLLLLATSSVTARIDVGNPSHSMNERYPANGRISGWVNVSLENESAEAVFRSRLFELSRSRFDPNRLTENEILTGSVTLIDWLRGGGLNAADYSCNPEDCNDTEKIDWDSNDTSKSFALRGGESKTYAFVIKKDNAVITKITDFELSVNSSNSSHRYGSPPLGIDVLDDSRDEWRSHGQAITRSDGTPYPHHSPDNWEPKNYGCFVDSPDTARTSISAGVEYCSVFTMNETREAYVGADVKNENSTSDYYFNGSIGNSYHQDVFRFSLYYWNKTGNSKEGLVGRCLADWGYNFSGGRASEESVHNFSGCEINDVHAVGEDDYLACVDFNPLKRVFNLQNQGFEITSLRRSNSCGFLDYDDVDFPRRLGYEFKIYVREKRYPGSGEFVLNTDEIVDGWDRRNRSFSPDWTLEKYLNDRLNETYEHNCSSGCVFPVRFTAPAGLSGSLPLNLSGFNLAYFYRPSPSPTSRTETERDLYDFPRKPALITTDGYERISLEGAGFSVGNFSNRSRTFSLRLGDREVSGNFSLLNSVFSVTNVSFPRNVDFGTPTTFSANVSNPESGMTYHWKFGNGPEIRTTGNVLTHSFNASGIFDSSLEVRNSRGASALKSFTVSVRTAKATSEGLLRSRRASLGNLTSLLNALPEFEKNSLHKLVNVSHVTAKLSELQTKNDGAGGNVTVYADVISRLRALENYELVSDASRPSIRFVPNERNVNLAALKRIAGGDYVSSRSREYKTAINSWHLNNVNLSLQKSTHSVTDGISLNGKKLFVYGLTLHDYSGADFFLVFSNSGFPDLEFDDDYDPVKNGSHVGIRLNGSFSGLKFSTTKEHAGFADLPVFVSPSLEDLKLLAPVIAEDDADGCKGLQCNSLLRENGLVVLFVVVALVLVAFVALRIVTGRLYRKKYEETLFKGSEDGLNGLLDYIGAARESIDDVEIRERLLERGWSMEQVNYAMRKYRGGEMSPDPAKNRVRAGGSGLRKKMV